MSTITALPCPPSLKCMLFGGYTPPAVPGRVHTLEDTVSVYQLSALSRKSRKVESPKKTAILNCFKPGVWLSVEQLSASSGSTTHYVQKQVLGWLRDEKLERRQIVAAAHKRWFEYRLVSKL